MAVDLTMASIRERALARVLGSAPYDPAAIVTADALAVWLSTGVQPGASSPPVASAVRRKLGRKPMRPDMHMRVPLLKDVAPVLPPAPARYTEYVDAVASFILGLNDRLGDCTCVCPANIILALTTLAQRGVRLTDDQILALYERFGYTPTDPATDQGAIIEDVLTSWHQQGIADAAGFDKLDGFATLDLHDHDRVMQAIAFLGPLDLGVSLPEGWMQATTWDVSTAGDQIAGGHCITAVGYTSEGPLIVSWGQVFTLTWAGWDAYVEEAHVLLSRDALTAAGKSPDGIDWAALSARMQAMEG